MPDLGLAFSGVRPGEMEMGERKGTVLTIDGFPELQEDPPCRAKNAYCRAEIHRPFPGKVVTALGSTAPKSKFRKIPEDFVHPCMESPLQGAEKRPALNLQKSRPSRNPREVRFYGCERDRR